MIRVPRSLSIGGAFAFAAFFVAGAAHEARAQIFDYAVNDPGGAGALGSAVARIGDVDSDFCDDFIVGEPMGAVGGVPGAGFARIRSGNTGSEIAFLYGPAGSNFGAAVEGWIDVDRDGYLDVLVGAPLDDSVASQAGFVAAYSPHLNSYPIVWYGASSGGQFGSCVRSLYADLDNDRVDDIVVGAPGIDTAYVMSGFANKVLLSNNGQSGSGFGTAVCGGGDLDGDGIVDYLVGSPNYVDSLGRTTGRVNAYSGKDGSRIWTVDGAADSKFGKSLTAAGDLDGDGVVDIVVGAPQHLDKNGNKTGCATVLSGVNASVLYKVFGDNKNDTFGHSVHHAFGDIDDDGTADFIVGAPQLLGSDVGYARAISGATGSTLFTLLEHTSDPNTRSDYGRDVAGGDWNGDGHTDLLVGGSNFNSGDGIAETWITAVATWQNYDSGWPGTNGVPGFTPGSNPAVGAPLDLQLDNSAGVTTTGLVVIGLSKANIPTGKGGTLLVDPLLFIALPVPASGLTLSGQVPNDPSLYGLDLYLQALELDHGASKGVSFTRGLDLFFGFY